MAKLILLKLILWIIENGQIEKIIEEKIKENTFDIILTNPPFAGTHDEPEILGRAT